MNEEHGVIKQKVLTEHFIIIQIIHVYLEDSIVPQTIRILSILSTLIYRRQTISDKYLSLITFGSLLDV